MPEALGDPPSPRTALFWNGTAWQWARVDAQGHLQIDVLTTGMDPLAASAANQALMLAQLQLIEDLRDALQSVANDRLIVRGEDQLHSYKEPYALRTGAVIGSADGGLNSATPAAGLVWHITSIAGMDINTALTEMYGTIYTASGNCRLFHEIRAIAAAEYVFHRCDLWLENGDVIGIMFVGSLATDTCRVELAGQVFTKE